jgi:hypothetical protein
MTSFEDGLWDRLVEEHGADLVTVSAPRQRSSRRPVLIGSTMTTMVGGGAVAAILLLSTGPSAAYAGWSPTPRATSRAELSKLASDCSKSAGILTSPKYPNGYNTGRVFTGTPILTETRGIFTAAIYLTHGRVYSCLYGARGTSWLGHDKSSGPIQKAPGLDQLGAPYGISFSRQADPNGDAGGGGREGVNAVSPWLTRLQNEFRRIESRQRPNPNGLITGRAAVLFQQMRLLFEGAGFGLDAYGQAGSGVSSVVFSFANGRTVTATVQHGWYFAWWPWTSYPRSVQVRSSSGTHTSPMTTRGQGNELKPSPACKPATPACVFDATP